MNKERAREELKKLKSYYSRVPQILYNVERRIKYAFYNTRKIINFDIKKYVAYKEMERCKNGAENR